MDDPLKRASNAYLNGDTVNSKEGTEDTHMPAYYRGYFSAVRRKLPNRAEETEPSILGSIVFNVALTAIPIGLFVLWQRAMTRGLTSDVSGLLARMTGSQRNFRVESKLVMFKDEVGIDDAKREVVQYVEFLKNPEKFSRLGARLPRGCLLTGQPGTGKTLLAKAIAGEANVPFFSCNGADFMELYVGSGPRTIRKLFQDAREVSPSIIFIDEIDAVGSRSKSGEGGAGGSGEENRTVNQLLTELDGLTSGQHTVLVFAATNFVEHVDEALLREGRFDRKVEVALPDQSGRCELFLHYLKKVQTGDGTGFTGPPLPPNATKEMLEKQRKEQNLPHATHTNREMAALLAELTPGVSPAAIASIVNEAAITAASRNELLVNLSSLKEAMNDVLIGKRQRISRMSHETTRRVALHECGHALVAWMLPQQRTVLRVSIVPRGQAAGFTQQAGKEALDSATHEELFSELCVLLGGRCAELLLHADLTTGAVDDLQRATESCRQQLLEWGMSHRLGHVSYRPNQQTGRLYAQHSAQLQQEVESETNRVLKLAETVTKHLLEAYRAPVLALRDLLMEKKELTTPEIEAVFGPRPVHSVLDPTMRDEIRQIYVGLQYDERKIA